MNSSALLAVPFPWVVLAAALAEADTWRERYPAVAEYLWAEVRHVRAHLTAERNHRTLELYALLVAALLTAGFSAQRASTPP